MLALGAKPTFDNQVFLGELVPQTVSRSRAATRLPGGTCSDVARAAAGQAVRRKLLTAQPDESRTTLVGLKAGEDLTDALRRGIVTAAAAIGQQVPGRAARERIAELAAGPMDDPTTISPISPA